MSFMPLTATSFLGLGSAASLLFSLLLLTVFLDE